MFHSTARFLLAIASIGLLLTACNNDVIFEKNIAIPDGSWDYANKLPFEFEVTDTTKTYQVLLDIQHAGDFGFQNCYVQISTRFPNGEEKKQPVSLELAAQSGIWVGECSGNDCEVEIPLQAKARFKQPGKHSITVEQFMRVNPLPGIKAIGLKIKQLE
jgi:gliding motility-associated lipoprotein GldH